MNQATLVRDLVLLEEMAAGDIHGTNLFIHIARVRELAEGGFYHLQSGAIQSPTTGKSYPVLRRSSVQRDKGR